MPPPEAYNISCEADFLERRPLQSARWISVLVAQRLSRLGDRDYPPPLARWIGIWNEIFPKSANLFVAVPPILIPRLVSSFYSAKSYCWSSRILLLCANNIVNGYMDGLLALHFTAAALIISALCGLDDRTEITPRESTWLVPLGVMVFAAVTLLKNEGGVGLLVPPLVGSIFALARASVRRDVETVDDVGDYFLSPCCCGEWLFEKGITTDLDQVGMAARFWSRLSNPKDVAEIIRRRNLLRAELHKPGEAFDGVSSARQGP